VPPGPSLAHPRTAPPPYPTILWLIRHGEADAAGRFCGRADVPLTERGRAQAEAAARALAGIPLGAVYAGDRVRARDTAAPIAARLGLEARIVPALGERNFGAWEGRPVEALARDAPDDLARLWDDPAFAPPDGESFDDLAARVLPAVDAIVVRHPGRAVAVVGHGGPHRAVLGRVLGLGPSALLALALDPGHAALVRRFPDGGAEVAALNLPPSGWADAWNGIAPAPVALASNAEG
jgi:broad specificity phosphatase PhoE